MTAIAALITAIAGAFYYGGTRAAAQAPQPAVTVTVTAPARTVTVPAQVASPAASTPAPPGSSPARATAAARTAYLADLTPRRDDEPQALSVIDTPQEIGAHTYPDSIRFTCSYPGDSGLYNNPSSIVYEVAGYSTLNMRVGIPSDATNASGNTATIDFRKDGTTKIHQTQTISLDQSLPLTIKLNGASQLAISCSGSTDDIDVAFGTATLSS